MEKWMEAFNALMDGLSGAHGEVTALLKDIKKSNEQIVSLLHNSRVAPMTDEPEKAVPASQYVDPDCISVGNWADIIAAAIFRLDLDGKDLALARVVYWTLRRFYSQSKPEAQTISALQVAISEIMRDKPAKPSKEFLRSQVKRCITRGSAALSRTEVDDIADNVMELVNGR